MDPRLSTLLTHPLLWQTGMARVTRESIATGFPALDERLPGRGWPAQGLIELLSAEPGRSGLVLLAPALVRSLQESNSWIAMIAPPFDPYAPAFTAAGLDANRILVIRTTRLAWALEQVARSAACRFILAWPHRMQVKSLRRLQLAAEQMGSLLVLGRPRNCRSGGSPAVLRVELSSTPAGLELDIFKSRGGKAGRVCLSGIR